MSKRLLSLLPLPPIWEHKIRSVSYENTKKLHLFLHVCDFLSFVCVRACTSCCRDSLTETNWQKTFEAEKRKEKKNAHIQQPVKSEMPLIFLSSASRLTRRERSAPTLLLQATRDRDGGRKKRRDGEEKDKGGKETDGASDMSFSYLKSFDSLNLSFLSRLWSFSRSLYRPPLPHLRQWKNKVCICKCQGRQGNKHLAIGPVSLRPNLQVSASSSLSKGDGVDSKGPVHFNMAHYADAAVSSHESAGGVCVFVCVSQHVCFCVCWLVHSFVCMHVYIYNKCLCVCVLYCQLAFSCSSSGAEDRWRQADRWNI